MKEIEKDIVLKENMLRVIHHHKKSCEGANCNVSLFLVKEVIEKANLKLSDEEKKLFI